MEENSNYKHIQELIGELNLSRSAEEAKAKEDQKRFDNTFAEIFNLLNDSWIKILFSTKGRESEWKITFEEELNKRTKKEQKDNIVIKQIKEELIKRKLLEYIVLYKFQEETDKKSFIEWTLRQTRPYKFGNRNPNEPKNQNEENKYSNIAYIKYNQNEEVKEITDSMVIYGVDLQDAKTIDEKKMNDIINTLCDIKKGFRDFYNQYSKSKIQLYAFILRDIIGYSAKEIKDISMIKDMASFPITEVMVDSFAEAGKNYEHLFRQSHPNP